MWYIFPLFAQVGFVASCNDAERSSAGRAKQTPNRETAVMNTTANAMWKISRLAVAIAFYALAMASTTFAAFYVSPTGDDGNAGTQASPFKTIQKALDSITKENCYNNKIMIEAGIYKIESELQATSGTYTYTIQSISWDTRVSTSHRAYACLSSHVHRLLSSNRIPLRFLSLHSVDFQ